ncbi:class I adenylate-forming enzyme family protein [Phreatobacter sp. HK31-P]
MSFVDVILLHGRLFPKRPAIMLMDRVVTFGMLGEAIHWVSARALASGIRPGDTVVLAIDNPIRFIAVAYAMMRLGVVIMPIAPGSALKAPLVGAVAVLSDMPGPAPVGLRMLVVDDVWFQPDPTPYSVDLRASDPGRLGIIALTSGTTGQNKLVPLTVGEFDHRISDLYRYQPAPGTERDLLLVGFSSIWALVQASRVLVAARTLGFAQSAEEAARMIDLYQMGTVIGSPHQLSALIEALETTPASCSSLRLVKTGGGLASPALVRAIRTRLCPHVIVIYGSTEGGRIALATGDMIDVAPGCVGLVAPRKRVEIVDDEGQPVAAGEMGRVRILVDGGGKPLQTGDLYPDQTPDWFYPGDLGSISADGMLVIAGRADDLINAGGLKVAPERVEDLVAGHPAIAEAAAFALPGPGGVDEIWLAVVPRQAISADEIIAHCRQRNAVLAPRHILVLQAIPRTGMGKAERARLKAMARG